MIKNIAKILITLFVSWVFVYAAFGANEVYAQYASNLINLYLLLMVLVIMGAILKIATKDFSTDEDIPKPMLYFMRGLTITYVLISTISGWWVAMIILTIVLLTEVVHTRESMNFRKVEEKQ